FEQGAVERWYEDNGWTYPVQGPAASGISGVQQFFEALGLTTPPLVEISTQSIHFQGRVGDRLEQSIRVETQEKRPVYAHAGSDQAWLRIGPIALEGRSARIPIQVPSVPARPGERLSGRVTVTANGNQRFGVDVNLDVPDGPSLARVKTSGIRTTVPIAQPAGPPPEHAISTIPYATVAPELPAYEPVPVAKLAASLVEPRHRRWPHAVPVLLLFLVIFGVVARDWLMPDRPGEDNAPVAVDELIDTNPRIEVRFHDGQKGDDADR